MSVVEKPISRTKLTFTARRAECENVTRLVRKRLIIAKQNLASFPCFASLKVKYSN